MAARRARGLVHVFAVASALLAGPTLARATDIDGVQPAALDQPRINALVRRVPGGPPLAGQDFFGEPFFNIQAFYDTGASGAILSESTARTLGVRRQRFPDASGPRVLFEDVGVAGIGRFNVSEPLEVALAPFHPGADVNNLATAPQVYNQVFGPLRLQIGELGAAVDPFFGGLDIFGTAVMAGKVVVMDPTPVDTLLDLMRTYVYAPGTPFNPGAAGSNPGIPATNRQVRLSYAFFGDFTRLTPPGAEGPALAHNPFIGPDPLTGQPATTPPVTVAFRDRQGHGSFLLDTGAASSIVSTALARTLGVRHVPGTEGTARPKLEIFDPDHPELPGRPLRGQFKVSLGGVGGTARAAGFFLDALVVPTVHGDPADPGDPAHLRFVRAPVLVSDVALRNVSTGQTFVFDGILGMNFMVASLMVLEQPPFFGDLREGAFDWIVVDEGQGLLGLNLKPIPDLAVVDVTRPVARADAGQSLSIPVTVANHGAAAAPVASIRLYLSTDRTRSDTDVELDGAVAVPALDPGQTLSASAAVAIPPTTPPGRYVVLACVDAAVAETSKANNCRPSDDRLRVTAPGT